MAVRSTLTFVDGHLAEPDADGALERPVNATVEMYVFDRLETREGRTVAAYFLADLDEEERWERLASLMAA